MIKDVICSLDLSHFQQIALVLFLVSFGAVIFGSAWLSQDSVDHFSAIPIDDEPKAAD